MFDSGIVVGIQGEVDSVAVKSFETFDDFFFDGPVDGVATAIVQLFMAAVTVHAIILAKVAEFEALTGVVDLAKLIGVGIDEESVVVSTRDSW